MHQTIKNAICLPCKGAEDGPLYPSAEGGVFDANHTPVELAFLRREYRQKPTIRNNRWDPSTGQQLNVHPLIVPGEIKTTKATLQGTYIFAGYLFRHFGHFLLESLAALWFIKENPTVPIIWMGVHNQPTLDNIGKQFVDLYGLENPIHILTEQTEIEALLVPEPGYRIHTRFTQKQVEALKLVEAPRPTIGKKVWLSRSELSEGLIHNETALEAILEQRGWTIYHPQNHPIRDQIHMFQDAEKIAGIEGSAFHLLMTMPTFQGEVAIFTRRKQLEFDYIMIAEALNIPHTYYMPGSKEWSHSTRHWIHNSFYLRLTPVLDALNEKRSDLKPAAPSNNIGILAQSLTQHFGHTLLVELLALDTTVAVPVTRCKTITVSERLGFDTNSLPKHTDYLDITPDQLFTSGILRKAPDLYCFRPHSDEQTLIRAFNNSISLAKPDTLWLIEYNAYERDLVSENNGKKDTARTTFSEGSSNHKLVQYIASCFPMFTIRRLKGSNAALIWQQPREMLTSSLSQFSEFTGLTAFDRSPVVSLNQAAIDFTESRDIS